MKLIPYREVLKMSKEKINVALAPIRAAKAKKQADLEMCKLDEEIAVMETRITEYCTEENINFQQIIHIIDKIALLERRKKQYQKIISELFPDE